MKFTTIGIDLAKHVFQIHAADDAGHTIMKKQLTRSKMLPFFANLTPCKIAMEACGGAHYWARKLRDFGHDVRLIAPQYVKPFVKRNKNDATDAEAICEAATRPNMPTVPIKTPEAQAILSVHRARQGFVKARTALTNQIHGLLSEFGFILPKGMSSILAGVPLIIEDANHALPATMRVLLSHLLEHVKILNRQVDELEGMILLWHKNNSESKRLATIPGVGPLTASAMIATVGDASAFKNGRQLAAWLGIVPKQHSTGGKSKLLGISKRGDKYLRTLLIHGARSVVQSAARKLDAQAWVNRLAARRHNNVAAVAMANKNARTIWALLTQHRDYDASYRNAA